MKYLKAVLLVVAVFLASFLVSASPLARENQAGAIIATGVLAWGVSLALNNVRSPILRAISVPDGLTLDKILNTALIALRRKLMPLTMFSTVFRDTPLEGTDTIQVPFVPLQQTASLDFDYDVGYEAGDGTLQTRPVVINRRKYQPLAITGYQLARMPILKLEEIMVKKAEQLAEDIIADIFSLVVAANYGAAAVTLAASSWDSDTVGTTLRKAANDAQWGEAGRSLIVNTAVDSYLLGDTAFKAAYAYGDNTVVREGKLPRAFGFDYAVASVFPDNGENLIALAALEYALLLAFSPIPPPPGVRKLMLDYRTMSDDNGLTLEFRQLADPQHDTDYHILECNYGFGKGDAAQLLRCVSA